MVAIFEVSHEVTVDEKWFFVSQLFLEKCAPIFEYFRLFLHHPVFDKVIVIVAALCKFLDLLVHIKHIVLLAPLEERLIIQLAI